MSAITKNHKISTKMDYKMKADQRDPLHLN